MFEFPFAKRTYKGRFLAATRPKETDALIFGLGLNPKLDRVWVVFRGEDGWWSAKGALTPLARAAIAAHEASLPKAEPASAG
ncbi:MAG: hypothetical protein ACRD6W_16190 [Nitrososphaerales archaeon]